MIYVVVRQTLDWEAATVGDLMDEFAQSTVRVWNRTFAMSYFTVRARIKALSMDCLRSLDPDVQVHEAGNLPASSPSNRTTCCCSATMTTGTTQRSLRKSERPRRSQAASYCGRTVCTGITPGRSMWTIPRLRPLDEPGVSGPVKTNNYAVSGEMAKSLRAVWAHPRIVRLFKEQGPVATRLSRPLSLVNRHPCSYTVWKHALRGVEHDEIGIVLRRLVTRYGFARVDQPMDPAFSWAAPYIERVQQVFRRGEGIGLIDLPLTPTRCSRVLRGTLGPCSRAPGTDESWARVDRKMLWSPAASSDRQRRRVLARVKARRYAPPPLRGAGNLDAGSAHALRLAPCLTMPNHDP